MSFRQDAKEFFILGNSYLFAFAYFFLCEQKKENDLITAIKGFSTFFLAYYASQKLPAMKKLHTALFLNASADWLIEQHFLSGMSVFFLGHLSYCAHLLPTAESPRTLTQKEIAGLTTFCAASAAITLSIQSNTEGALFYALPFYAAALASTVVLCVLQKERRQEKVSAALLFIFSDMLIAGTEFIFKTPIPYTNKITWATYYAAQWKMVNNHQKKEKKTEPLKTRRVIFE